MTLLTNFVPRARYCNVKEERKTSFHLITGYSNYKLFYPFAVILIVSEMFQINEKHGRLSLVLIFYATHPISRWQCHLSTN